MPQFLFRCLSTMRFALITPQYARWSTSCGARRQCQRAPGSMRRCLGCLYSLGSRFACILVVNLLSMLSNVSWQVWIGAPFSARVVAYLSLASVLLLLWFIVSMVRFCICIPQKAIASAIFVRKWTRPEVDWKTRFKTDHPQYTIRST